MSHTSSSRSRRVAFLGVAFVFGSAITGFANSGADVALADEHANFAVGQKYEVASIEPAHNRKFAGHGSPDRVDASKRATLDARLLLLWLTGQLTGRSHPEHCPVVRLSS